MSRKGRHPRAACLLIAIAAGLLAPATTQAANVIVGSPLTASFSPVVATGPVTFMNNELPAGANLNSPVTGTIVSWSVIDASGGPFKLRVLYNSGPGTFAALRSSEGQTPTSMGIQSFPANLPIRAGDFVGLDTAKSGDTIGRADETSSSYMAWVPALADGTSRPPSVIGSDRQFGFNAEVRPVSNDIAFGKVKKNKRTGTAKLTVTVPDPGLLTLFGKGLKKVTATATAPGSLILNVKPKGHTKQELSEDGREKVTVKVQFAPTGIAPATELKKLTLRKNG
jgi:hypothetical protein